MVKTNVGDSQGKRTKRPIVMRHGLTCLHDHHLTMTVISQACQNYRMAQLYTIRAFLSFSMMVILAISFASLKFSSHLNVSI